MGRPREFDIEKALDKALKVFWRKGYEGATLPDLTKAMGINRPSLYAAFGNKEALFRKALDRYMAGPACHVGGAVEQPTARSAVERFLSGTIELITDSRNPQGCFLVQAALACGDMADPLRKETARRREVAELALRQRLVRAIREGDLPAATNAAVLSRYIVTVAHGLAVQAAGGVKRAELKRVVEVALKAWPS